MSDDLSLGMVGVSEGNGHPYSFSAIVNGYDDEGFAASDWGVIHDYLRAAHPAEFGLDGVAVTHAWTQDPAETRRLCAAARIPTAVDDPADLRDAVDAVVVARDDHERHRELATPLLEAGLPVFVDKPLAMAPADLRAFRPYLEAGQLMSCSGMRYAPELDGPRSGLDGYGDLRLVRGAVVRNWANYGVHLLDAILNVVDARPVSVRANEADHQSVSVTLADGTLVQVDALGDGPFVLDVDIYGSGRRSHHELRDNFRAFRRTLWEFVEMVRTGEPPIPPAATLDVVRVLIAGERSMADGRRVDLEEVDV